MTWPARHKNGGHEQVVSNARETNYQPDNVSPAILDFYKTLILLIRFKKKKRQKIQAIAKL
jgi:hypothetical protein